MRNINWWVLAVYVGSALVTVTALLWALGVADVRLLVLTVMGYVAAFLALLSGN